MKMSGPVNELFSQVVINLKKLMDGGQGEFPIGNLM